LLQIAGVAVLTCILVRPLLTPGAIRGSDFWVHYWYVWHQSDALRHGGPSLFLHDTYSVFVPHYAFYGGTLYVVTGSLGLLVGSVFRAYVAAHLLGCAAAYGGWWWLGRQAGLGRFAAHAPALVFATSAYSITLVASRGDWPELMAVSSIPLLVASTLSVLRADRMRLLPALALIGSSVIFSGSHNLSLLFGTTFLLVLAVVSLLCIPQARTLISRRGAGRVAALLAPALLVNAWFLVPDMMYQSHTYAARQRPVWRDYLHQFTYLVSFRRLSAIDRGGTDPVLSAYGVYALPVLAMAWTAVTVVVCRSDLARSWGRALLVSMVATAGLIIVMTHVGLLHGPYAMLQFSVRLESYVNLAVSGGVLAALVIVRERPRAVRHACSLALAAIVLASVVQAADQAGNPRDTAGATDVEASPSFHEPVGDTHVDDYSVGDLPVGSGSGIARLLFPVGAISDGSVSLVVAGRAGQPFFTNIISMPQLIDVRGAKVVAVDEGSRLVLELDATTRAGPLTIAVSEARPLPVVLGRWLSLLGLAGLGANLAFIARGRWRRRRASDLLDAATPAGDRESLVAAS
jgi:hypothetical protein